VSLRAARVQRSEVGKLSGLRPGRSFPLPENDFEEFLKISVTDSGIGISPEGLEGLFKPFSQIDSGLARKFEGTGLGLAMIKLLAELHGGTLAAESTAGEVEQSLSVVTITKFGAAFSRSRCFPQVIKEGDGSAKESFRAVLSAVEMSSAGNPPA